MTYNIRGYFPCDTFKEPSHHWYYRQDKIIDIIKKERPDILGLQEVFNISKEISFSSNGKDYKMGYLYDSLIVKNIKELHQEKIYISPPNHLIRDYVREKLIKIGYAYFYKAGASPKIIFYKEKKFKFIKGNVYYHNQTNRKSSTFLFLKYIKTKEIILIINTHLINKKKNYKIREKSIDFIFNKITEVNKNDHPVIFMGDFNINIKSKEYKYLSNKLKKYNLINSSNDSTYNGFGIKKKKIDYIFYSSYLKRIDAKVIRNVYNIDTNKMENYNGNIRNNILFPSDHWALKVKFNMDSKNE